MRSLHSLFGLTLVLVLSAPGMAQLNQTIQLPTFAFTTVSTTVSVPDRGEALLGGVKRFRSGRNQVGTPLVGKLPFVGRPFNNVGIGKELEASNISVRAYIHDFEAMDEALLAQAAANRRGLSPRGLASRNLVGQNPAAPSIAQIRQAQLNTRSTPLATSPTPEPSSSLDELRDLWNRAREAELNGKPHIAKIFYRMVSRDSTGRVRTAALARLEALNNPTASKLAASPAAR